jgi:hypothetical protein
MKIKRKLPVLEALMKRILLARFEQIQGFWAEGDEFYIVVASNIDVTRFAEEFAAFVKHPLDEFGEPAASYTFHLQQNQMVKFKLIYSEINNISAIAV